MSELSTAEWLVIAGGISAIAWVNWYFFFAGRSVASATSAVTAAVAATGVPGELRGQAAGSDGAGTDSGGPAAGLAQVTIVVDGGYKPALIRVKAGEPVQLHFDRRDTSGCSEEVVLPDFGIKRYLPTGQTTTIEITPPSAGRYEFMCGMSMLRGAIIADA